MTNQSNETQFLHFLLSPHLNPQVRREWLEQNWTVSVYIAAIYIIFVHAGQHFMKERKSLDLKNFLIIWNFALTFFSILLVILVGYDSLPIISQNGLHSTTCEGARKFPWLTYYIRWLFNVSKVVELGDTLFLILRKRPVIFLHWYHHSTVLIYTWYAIAEYSAISFWFTNINCLIHCFMYTYFVLMSLGLRVPKGVGMTLTSIQTGQMVIGAWICVYVGLMQRKGIRCEAPFDYLIVSFVMYIIYVGLFTRFFLKSYMGPSSVKAERNGTLQVKKTKLT